MAAWLAAGGRALLEEDVGLVLSLDAANPTPALLSLAGGAGDATWTDAANPAGGVELHNAGGWLPCTCCPECIKPTTSNTCTDGPRYATADLPAPAVPPCNPLTCFKTPQSMTKRTAAQ